ncbi:2',5' RNA ligase family [Sporotomaculum syntrophicum]|uniref:RNA 2',3'-cyclic phosphodiesterase n=1 Tax=Sporotomaculum syntrophicum TaxID=182264 RepID=A0A9D2WMS7_9FIRM|nr:RNA 2',3'-cyclic phosphodiesterase [Sporotomaculum syntrophicum]KAF1084064.1 2',5' RNA ligase family [Sporotomaculum syntrophicum]
MQLLRLFWAVNLPLEIIRKLAVLQAYLKSTPANVKWVEQQNLHLTVKFLGVVDKMRVGEIISTVAEATAGTGSFELALGGLGFFPNPRRPRVLWVGVRGDVDKFRLLHQQVEECLAAFGWALDKPNFAPHLTLGRLRTPQGSEGLVRKVDEIGSNWGVSGITVSTIDLMKSVLTPKGPVYQVLNSIKLDSHNKPAGK